MRYRMGTHSFLRVTCGIFRLLSALRAVMRAKRQAA